ncbi:Uncharacterised protein [Klebsiella michiganensis]|nr:Uncharacterised protein [Klebsiella michiganensis]
MIFNRFITYITGRGEQAVGAIGWQELGNWATGLTVDNRQQSFTTMAPGTNTLESWNMSLRGILRRTMAACGRLKTQREMVEYW